MEYQGKKHRHRHLTYLIEGGKSLPASLYEREGLMELMQKWWWTEG